MGANVGNNDVNTVAKMIDLCNDYGLDAIEIGHPLSIWMEATEKGWTNGDGGLKWGDIYGMTEAVRKIAFREGIGNIMADGANATAKHFGHPEVAMTVKGQGIPAYDPRGMKGMGVAYATSNRGACHLRAYVAAAELNVMPFRFTQGRSAGVEGQGRTDEGLPGHPRLFRQPGPVQVQCLCRWAPMNMLNSIRP